MEKYFTVAVTLIHEGEGPLRFKNLTEVQLKELQKIIWVQGVKKTINHTTVEWICPLVIKRVIVSEQVEGYIQ